MTFNRFGYTAGLATLFSGLIMPYRNQSNDAVDIAESPWGRHFTPNVLWQMLPNKSLQGPELSVTHT